MADRQPPPAAGKSGGKVLGMPRTTGLIVIAGVALVVGYFVISHFSGSSSSSPGGGGGPGVVAAPGPVQVITRWQPRQRRRPHHDPRKLRPPWRPQ